MPDGKEQSKECELSKIEILYKIDVDRLKKLDKNDPKSYYDYAEELANKKLDADPEAKDVAGRCCSTPTRKPGTRPGVCS